jgi:hypothetical protein
LSFCKRKNNFLARCWGICVEDETYQAWSFANVDTPFAVHPRMIMITAQYFSPPGVISNLVRKLGNFLYAYLIVHFHSC